MDAGRRDRSEASGRVEVEPARVLALSTSTSRQGVCLRLPGRAPVVAVDGVRRGAPRTLDRRVFALLRAEGLEPSDLDLVVADVGPGSFTGLRLGLAMARALAWAHGLPAVGVGSLEAMAHAGGRGTGRRGHLLALLPSRRGVVYAGLYRCGPEPGVALCAEDEVPLVELPAWLQRAAEADRGLLAPTPVGPPELMEQVAEVLAAAGQPLTSLPSPLVSTCEAPDPAVIAAIGVAAARGGLAVSALGLEPRYLAVSEAERHAGEVVSAQAIPPVR